MDDYVRQLAEQSKGFYKDSIDAIVQIIKDTLPKDKAPTDITDAEIDDLLRETEATVGPQFTRLRERAVQDFDISKRFAQENISKVFATTREDVGIQKGRIARNLQEATSDTAAALASRNLAFGGTRRKAERQLGEQAQMQTEDLEREARRKLDAGQLEFERRFGSRELPTGISALGGEFGIEQIGQTRTLEDISRERAQSSETEFQRRLANRNLTLPIGREIPQFNTSFANV